MNNQGQVDFLQRKTNQPHLLRSNDSGFDEIKLNQKDYRDGLVMKKTKSISHPKQIRVYHESEKVAMSAIKLMLKACKPDQVDNDLVIETQGYPKKSSNIKHGLSTDQKLRGMINDQFNTTDQLKQMFTQYQRRNLLTNLDELRHQLKGGAYVDVQHQLSQNNLKSIELEDDEQINCFMQQMCRDVGGMTTTSILGLEESAKIKSDSTQLNEQEQWENMNHIIQKRKTKDQLQKIFQKEEENQKQKLIQMYKDTKIEQFEVDTKKNNKMNLVTLKRVQEAQTSLFDSNHKDMPSSSPSLKKKFLRSPKKFVQQFKSVESPVKVQKDKPALLLSPLMRKQAKSTGASFVSSLKMHTPERVIKFGYYMGQDVKKSFESNMDDLEVKGIHSHQKSSSIAYDRRYFSNNNSARNKIDTSTRPQSSVNKKGSENSHNTIEQKSPVNLIQDFISVCQKSEQKSQKIKTQIKRKISGLDRDLKKQLQVISTLQMNETDDHHDQFEDFQVENKFKKKLLTFLMNRTHNKLEILSKKRIEQNMREINELMH